MAVQRNRRLQEETPTRLKLNLCEKTVTLSTTIVKTVHSNSSIGIELKLTLVQLFLFRTDIFITLQPQPYTLAV